MTRVFDNNFNNPFVLRAVSFVALMVAVTQNAFACTADEITLSDNSCVPVKFIATTINLTQKNRQMQIQISAKGTFYIDWGDGNVQPINRTTTSTSPYSHRYSDKGVHTIRIGGLATGYNTDPETPAIDFSNMSSYLGGIDGSLTDLFPELGTSSGQQPSFYETFEGCSRLESRIPENLFRGITHANEYMFYRTFYDCSRLTGFVPPSAFGGLIQNGHPYDTDMMEGIFDGSGLTTSCPAVNRRYTTGYEADWYSKVSCGTEYALTYVMNDGTNYAGAPTTFWDDEATTISGIPTKADNVFSGWCTDSGLTDCYMSYTIPIYTITPQTIYAKWTPCTACATTNASCTLSVVNNVCTYTTACNAGYENIQNDGAYNASCTPISASGCAGGYYRNNGSCVPVGAGYWSAYNSDTRTQCPAGTTTIGYGVGADQATDCGYELHVGANTIYLRQDKQTTRTLNVQIGNTIYYANMSTTNIKMSDNVDNYLKVNVGGTVYSVYDDSGEEYTNNP